MILVEKHIINHNHKYYNILDETAYKAKNLYNATLYAVRQHFFNTNEYLSYAKIQREFQNAKQFDYYELPCKVSQWVMKMVDHNFKSFFKANKEYKNNPSKFNGKPKLPKYLDKTQGRYLITYTNQAISKKLLETRGLIKLSGIEVYIPTKLKYTQINQVRVVKRTDSYIIEIIYNYDNVDLKRDNNRYASIDLGIDNLATVTTNTEVKPFAVNGKKLKSYNHYYNKKLSEYKSILKVRNNKETSNRIRIITNKRNNKVNDYLHKSSRYIVNQLVSNNINTLIIGYNKEWKQDTNIGKVNNQNFVQIPHGRFVEMLCYKCEMCGINVMLQEESYTSKCSFLDNESIEKHDKYVGRRIKRGLFKSANGKLINSDVNGSYNIMRKCKPNAFANGIKGVVVHPSIIKIEN